MIEDDREKYAAYLCSREWGVLKHAVHERANGVCERCKVFLIDAVHHLTYERKYAERLEDLQGICEHCHDFTHGKSDHDPKEIPDDLGRYLNWCVRTKVRPTPPEFIGILPAEFPPHLRKVAIGLSLLRTVWTSGETAISAAMNVLDESLGFAYACALTTNVVRRYEQAAYRACLTRYGFLPDEDNGGSK